MKQLKKPKELEEFIGELINIFDEHAKEKLKWENPFINGKDYDTLCKKIKETIIDWNLYKIKKGGK